MEFPDLEKMADLLPSVTKLCPIRSTIISVIRRICAPVDSANYVCTYCKYVYVCNT